jgi:hypothetical protein
VANGVSVAELQVAPGLWEYRPRRQSIAYPTRRYSPVVAKGDGRPLGYLFEIS